MPTIIVAGGATGIGRAAIRGFRARGDDVVMIDDRPEARDMATEPGDGRIMLLPRDLADPAVPGEAVDAAVAAFGGVDTVLVAAARMRSAPLAVWTSAMWDETAAMNLKMPFLLTQAAAPHLAQSGNASVTFISSTAAIRGSAGAAAYQATSAGLGGMMRSLTDELGPSGIRVNCVLPGWMDTPFNDAFWATQDDADAKRARIDAGIPLRRHGSADEVAAMILFLASPGGRYVTGASIVIDGGHSAV